MKERKVISLTTSDIRRIVKQELAISNIDNIIIDEIYIIFSESLKENILKIEFYESAAHK